MVDGTTVCDVNDAMETAKKSIQELESFNGSRVASRRQSQLNSLIRPNRLHSTDENEGEIEMIEMRAIVDNGTQGVVEVMGSDFRKDKKFVKKMLEEQEKLLKWKVRLTKRELMEHYKPTDVELECVKLISKFHHLLVPIMKDVYRKQFEGKKPFKVFICHPGYDKESYALPLKHYLEKHGVGCDGSCDVFVDKESLSLGGEPTDEMIWAVLTCEVFWCVASPPCVQKWYPMRELHLAYARYLQEKETHAFSLIMDCLAAESHRAFWKESPKNWMDFILEDAQSLYLYSEDYEVEKFPANMQLATNESHDKRFERISRLKLPNGAGLVPTEEANHDAAAADDDDDDDDDSSRSNNNDDEASHVVVAFVEAIRSVQVNHRWTEARLGLIYILVLSWMTMILIYIIKPQSEKLVPSGPGSLHDGKRIEVADASLVEASTLEILAELKEREGDNTTEAMIEVRSYYAESLEKKRHIYGGKDNCDLAKTLLCLGYAEEKLDNFQEALGHYEEALEMERRLYGASAKNEDLEKTLLKIANLEVKLGNYELADAHYEEAWTIEREIREGEATDASFTGNPDRFLVVNA